MGKGMALGHTVFFSHLESKAFSPERETLRHISMSTTVEFALSVDFEADPHRKGTLQ